MISAASRWFPLKYENKNPVKPVLCRGVDGKAQRPARQNEEKHEEFLTGDINEYSRDEEQKAARRYNSKGILYGTENWTEYPYLLSLAFPFELDIGLLSN